MCCAHVALNVIEHGVAILESLSPNLGNVLYRKAGHLHLQTCWPLAIRGNAQLMKILNVSRQESSQYIFLGQKNIQLSLVISPNLKVASHRKDLLYWICSIIPSWCILLSGHLLPVYDLSSAAAGFLCPRACAGCSVILNKCEYLAKWGGAPCHSCGGCPSAAVFFCQVCQWVPFGILPLKSSES